MTDRGVSIAVSHVLALGITTLLISGLLVAGTSFVRDDREQATESAIQTTGSRLVAEVTEVDHAVIESDADGTLTRVSLTVDHGSTIGNAPYTVSVRPDGDCADAGSSNVSCLEVRASTARGSITQSVPWRNETPVRRSTVRGGPVRIVANESWLWLEAGDR